MNAEMRYDLQSNMNAKRYLPLIYVSFHTEDECYQMKGELVDSPNELDPTRHVVSVNTSKTMESPAGTFTVELIGDEWMNRINPNDLVVIRMGYIGENTHTVMVGLVDGITRSRTISSDGQPMVTTSINGRDFGKLFIKAILKFYPEIGNSEEYDGDYLPTYEGMLTVFSFFSDDQVTSRSPGGLIDQIMRYIFPRLINTVWTVYDESGSEPKPKKVSAQEIVRYQLEKLDFFIPFMLTADEYEGSLWNMMERIAPKPFAELFIDTRDSVEASNTKGKPMTRNGTLDESSNPSKANLSEDEGYYPAPAFNFSRGENSVDAKVLLTLRETPFDTKNWDKLQKHTIHLEDVISDSFSKSDEEHYNLFWAGTTLNPLGSDMKRETPPLLNEPEALKFGLSPLEVQIEGLDIKREEAEDHQSQLENIGETYTPRLKAWFENNHKYWSGNVTLRGNSAIRIGQVVHYDHPTVNREFYVEGVNQNFSVFENWQTSLTVTRGMGEEEVIDHTSYLPEEPETAQSSSSEGKSTHYTVVRGDNLWDIAGREYGNPLKWRRIWEANKQMLIERDSRNVSNEGHWIYPGQKLVIPKE